MTEQLLNHIDRYELCKTTDKILLAVSGGMDSMVMLHLMKAAGFRLGVAHCNFRLRGDASAGDEAFVRETCAAQGLEFHSRSFDTAGFAAEQGISTQMAARDLRYAFFAEVRDSAGYDLVATAHHINDTIESILLNLVRGTGIDGLRGIAPRIDHLIRPLLFATRDMIAAYANENSIEWREDATNETDDYARNLLRHQVVPQFTTLNPSFGSGFRLTHDRLMGARAFALEYIAQFRRQAVEESANGIMAISIEKLAAAPFPAVMLWELIKNKGFRYQHCVKIVQDHQPGKLFYTDTHQLLVDRMQYVIEPKRLSAFVTNAIEQGAGTAGEGVTALIIKEVMRADFSMTKDAAVAQLDADRLQFPLLWRRWRAGDYFKPLGMQTEKKLSDFLIDLKIPFNAKADITVLESAGDIVWVVGLRISERYKVDSNTQRILVIRQADRDVSQKRIS